MSIQAATEMDPLLQGSNNKLPQLCCVPKYSPRKVASKGAKLILLWNFLMMTSAFSTDDLNRHHTTVSIAVLLLVLLASALISGCLADTKLGRYTMVSAGLSAAWLGRIISTLYVVLQASLDYINEDVASAIRYTGTVIMMAGCLVYAVNIVQFAMEQMYDTTSENITAFISWFAITLVAGVWFQDFIDDVFASCLPTEFNTVPSAIHVALLSILLSSNFLFKNWFTDHKKSYNTITTVYRVLKYAKQHKYPVNRSAFTYWEEEIPSRIDLGKAKYGGPFTTEEVEDVKTLLRIMAVMATIILSLFAAAFDCTGWKYSLSKLKQPPHTHKHGDACTKALVYVFSYGSGFVAAIVCTTYEVIVYPICKKWLPSMLKRIGICLAFAVMVGVSLIVLTALMETTSASIPDNDSLNTATLAIASLFVYTFVTATIEFIAAQSPDNMKGFIFACSWFSTLALFLVVALTDLIWKGVCVFQVCYTTLTAFNACFMVVCFGLYCFTARWYKRRERDEPCSERAIIEDIYSRRVEQNDTEP